MTNKGQKEGRKERKQIKGNKLYYQCTKYLYSCGWRQKAGTIVVLDDLHLLGTRKGFTSTIKPCCPKFDLRLSLDGVTRIHLVQSTGCCCGCQCFQALQRTIVHFSLIPRQVSLMLFCHRKLRLIIITILIIIIILMVMMMMINKG